MYKIVISFKILRLEKKKGKMETSRDQMNLDDIINQTDVTAVNILDDLEEEGLKEMTGRYYLTKTTFYMCLMKLKSRFDEDDLEIDRIKDDTQIFLEEQKMYPSKNSKRKRRLGHYNFNELKNHEIYRNDVKLVLAICPPTMRGDLRGWDLKYLQKKVNERIFMMKRELQFAFIRSEDMRRREDFYPILKEVFETWKLKRGVTSLREAGD